MHGIQWEPRYHTNTQFLQRRLLGLVVFLMVLWILTIPERLVCPTSEETCAHLWHPWAWLKYLAFVIYDLTGVSVIKAFNMNGTLQVDFKIVTPSFSRFAASRQNSFNSSSDFVLWNDPKKHSNKKSYFIMAIDLSDYWPSIFLRGGIQGAAVDSHIQFQLFQGH